MNHPQATNPSRVADPYPITSKHKVIDSWIELIHTMCLDEGNLEVPVVMDAVAISMAWRA